MTRLPTYKGLADGLLKVEAKVLYALADLHAHSTPACTGLQHDWIGDAIGLLDRLLDRGQQAGACQDRYARIDGRFPSLMLEAHAEYLIRPRPEPGKAGLLHN